MERLKIISHEIHVNRNVFDKLATKDDFHSMKFELKSDIGILRTEMGALKTEIHKEINAQTWKFFGAIALAPAFFKIFDKILALFS